MVRVVAKKDLKGRREFVAYQIEPSVAGSVRDRLGELSKGERVSLFRVVVALPSESIGSGDHDKPEEMRHPPDSCGVCRCTLL